MCGRRYRHIKTTVREPLRYKGSTDDKTSRARELTWTEFKISMESFVQSNGQKEL